MLPEAGDVLKRIGVEFGQRLFVVACHLETLEHDSTGWTSALFDALSRLDGQIVFCFPNADAGSRAVITRARRFMEDRTNTHLVVNLPAPECWALMKAADLLIGNSSSGVMEAASLRKAAINVGARQDGREHGENVIDVPADSGAILRAADRALSAPFQQMLVSVENPYGDGHASERIVQVRTTTALGMSLLVKRAAPLGPVA